MDQAYFRSALIKSGLRIATLLNNYNFRANIENNLAKAVKILHAHGELERIAGYINAKTSMRIYIPSRRKWTASRRARCHWKIKRDLHRILCARPSKDIIEAPSDLAGE